MLSRRSIACPILALSLLPASLTATPPLPHAAMWLAERVGSPTVSPDGAWAVFGVTEPSFDPEASRSDLWIAATDGSAPPRRLTSADGGEGGVAWSPDGRHLAFTAKRDRQDKSQVWILSLADGGEARPITDAPLGAGSPRWSPDGTRILFSSRGYSGAVGEAANREALEADEGDETNLLAYEDFPIRRWDRWLDETRPRLYVIEVAPALEYQASDSLEKIAAATAEKEESQGEDEAEEEPPAPVGGAALDLLGGSQLVAGVGFRGTWGRNDDGLDGEWTPDGRGIVFAATENGHEAARAPVEPQLYLVDVPGPGGEPGEPRRITDGARAYSSPAFAPDGDRLCVYTAAEATVIYDQTEVACASWPAAPGASLDFRPLTDELDRSLAGFTWDPTGAGIYLAALDAGHVHVWHADWDGELRRVATAESGVYGGLSSSEEASNPVLLGLWGSATKPDEVVRIDPASGERTLLTRFNVEDAARWDTPELEEFWTEGPEGRRLHSFLLKPPGFDPTRKYPALALMHGGHASMWRDAIHPRWNYHLLSQPDFVLIATDYRGSTGYGEDFTLAIAGDPLRGPAEDIIAAVDDAAARFDFIDGDRVCAAGASYGGHLANWLAGASDRFECLVSHAGLASLEQQWATSDVIYHREQMMGGPFWEDPQKWLDQSPLMQAPGFDVPILMSIGVNDYRVPLGNTLAMWSALERMDTPAKLLVWEKSNHWIMNPRDNERFYQEVRAWLERWLHEPAAESR